MCMVLTCLAGCAPAQTPPTTNSTGPIIPTTAPEQELPAFVDYAANLTLDMRSNTKKLEVTVKGFVDGDTTHFFTEDPAFPNGVLKARYLAVNTPESTGKIEEYGKTASLFTREKLENADSIIVESDDNQWNLDSTGDRMLVWVWYKTADMDSYRNLNLELLQNGLARASNTAQNSYGSVCMNALNQAKVHGLHLYSGQQDPNFYYGGAQELTLKELRTNIENYANTIVAFTGIVTQNSGSNMVYVESYDEETSMTFGMSVYYGFNLSGTGLSILNVGNEVRIVGSVQYYEAGGSWQVSDLTYKMMKPNDPMNIQKLSTGHQAAWTKITAETFHDNVTLNMEEGSVELPFAQMALSTSVSMDNLLVMDAYTTTNEESSSKGAMTLNCKAENGNIITVRTAVLKDDNGNLITKDAYMGKTIDVKGIVDIFDGEYQIKVFLPAQITIHE